MASSATASITSPVPADALHRQSGRSAGPCRPHRAFSGSRPTGSRILFKTDLDYIDMGGYNADYYLDRFKVFPGTTTPNPNYTDLFNIHYNSPQKALDKFFRSTLRIQYEFASGTNSARSAALRTPRASISPTWMGQQRGNITRPTIPTLLPLLRRAPLSLATPLSSTCTRKSSA